MSIYTPINWNNVSDFDNQIMKKITQDFWLPEKIPLSNDIKTYNILSEQEKYTFNQTLGGLTMLDTYQANAVQDYIRPIADTPHAQQIFNYIGMIEGIVHSRSYSSIFSTLSSTDQINEIFKDSEYNEYNRNKLDIINHIYSESKKDKEYLAYVASALLETFCFYSGFYYTLYLNTKGLVPNTGDIIRLIMQDEQIHGYYGSAKFQFLFNQNIPEDVAKEVIEYRNALMINEVKYAHQLYDPLGLTNDVIKFLHYNANRAFMNLGLDKYCYPDELCNVSTSIKNAILTTSENHDFFSGSGSSYINSIVTDTKDEDWA